MDKEAEWLPPDELSANGPRADCGKCPTFETIQESDEIAWIIERNELF
jgi:hypothetical protein